VKTVQLLETLLTVVIGTGDDCTFFVVCVFPHDGIGTMCTAHLLKTLLAGFTRARSDCTFFGTRRCSHYGS
jgi:hypothetical protein